MRTDDDNNYTTVTYKKDNGTTMSSAKWWKYGKEIWCNMQGQYTTIVADLSELAGDYEMSLCNVGIMGTQYYRTKDISAEIFYPNTG